MSYRPLDDILTGDDNTAIDFAKDLLYRKEFYVFGEDTRDYRDPNDFDIMRDKYLKLRAHQLFVRNFMSQNTPYRSIVLKWKPGTGKTAGAIAIAQTYISLYQKIFNMRIMQLGPNRRNIATVSASTPSVIVLGFTKLNIIKELLKYPEFGFITIVERDELSRLQKLSLENVGNMQHYKEYLSMLRRRISNKMKGGFYKFYGYQEFVNRLFISDGIDLTQLETIAMKSAESGEAVTRLEKTIADFIAAGKIQINLELMKQFENSLLICDEIHDTYNQHMKNNYGVAIQYVLDSVPSLRAVFLTATPLNNSPTEIVEVLNYVLSGTGQTLTKKKLFGSGFNFDEVLERIRKLSIGRFSFVQDINIRYYPSVSTDGERRMLRHPVGEFNYIPYVTIWACPMSPMHLNTYKEFLKQTNQLTETTKITVSVDSFAIQDMCFPNPQSDEIGLWKSGEVKSELSIAPAEWKSNKGIRVSSDFQISGTWLSRENVGIYSSKYVRLLDAIDESFARSRERLRNHDLSPYTAGEKIMIYHERVRASGVLQIASLLRENFIVDEFSEPVDATLCATCGYPLGSHDADVKKAGLVEHMYYPCRFVVAHSEIDKLAMLHSVERYNSSDNSYGTRYKFLIGSKIIRQSYDIKDTEYMIILSLPVNISGLIQLRGRVERHASHHGLTADRRKVVFSYYVSVVPQDENTIDTVSVEEYRYIDKFSNYMNIQRIDQVINSAAIDGPLVHKTNIRLKQSTELSLSPLAFKPIIELDKGLDLKQLNQNTWLKSHGSEEVAVCCLIIKRLFMIAPAYSYDELWRLVQSPPFGVEVNPKLFDERNFAVALDMLVSFDVSYVDKALDDEISQRNTTTAERMIINMLFDESSRYIYVGFVKHKIECVGNMYIRFAVVTDTDVVGREIVIKDIESFIRPAHSTQLLRINLDRWLADNKIEYNYQVDKQKFIDKYTTKIDGKLPDITSMIGEYNVEFYQMLYMDVIRWFMMGVDNSEEEVSDEVGELYKRICQLADKFNGIVYIKDIVKYKDTAKKFVDGDIIVADGPKYTCKVLPMTTPIGFCDVDAVRAFDGKRWLKINKAALNIRTQFVENKVIVGYFDVLTHGTAPKFKIRHSSRKAPIVTNDKQVDIRTFERGIVCSTKSKPQIIEVMKELGLVNPTGTIRGQSLSVSGAKINTLCYIIRQRLIELEIKERERDSDIKYLYAWHEVQ